MIQQSKRQSNDLTLSKQIEIKNNQMLAQNQQIIQNLNKRIDRRLDIGYYCEVPAIRTQRNYLYRKIYVPKNIAQKKKYPIVKRKKKEQKITVVDCQQNTNQIEFEDGFQNTSRLYTLKKWDPDIQETAMQWSYEVQTANQQTKHFVEIANQSVQYQFVEVQDISIQYEDPEGFTNLIELKDTSIQYDIESKKQIIVEDKETQYLSEEKFLKCIQFDEIKPIVLEKNLQIGIPDFKNIQKIEQLQQSLFKVQKEKKRQTKINKAYKSKLQILKLKQQITKIQNQIQIVQIKSKNVQIQKYKEKQLKTQRDIFLNKRKRDLAYLNRQFQNKLSGLINSVKMKEKINKNESSIKRQTHLQKEKQDENIINSLQNSKEQLLKTKNHLKDQMQKRLRYQSEQENQDKESSPIWKNQHRRSQLQNIRMKRLFPNPEKHDRLFAGTIIRNIINSNSPIKCNQESKYFRFAHISRAYCERRQQVSSLLNQSGESLQKDSLLKSNLIQSQQIKKLRSSSIRSFKNKNVYKYTKVHSGYVLNMQEIVSLQAKIKNLHRSQIYFKYLYKEQEKMLLGYELFKIFNAKLIIQRQIEILKFKDYMVYTYFFSQITYFVIFYHSLNYLFYGEQPQIISNFTQFFSHPSIYKDYWGIQYCSPNITYNGGYQRGKKHDFGIHITDINVYIGSFEEDNKVGSGKNIFQNGDQFEGEFKNNYANGQGIYIWKNGEKYEGYFENGKRHGYGRHIYPNGDIFQGFFSNNLKEGKGKQRRNNGTVFQGYYKNDMKFGEGKITNPDDSYFIGIWNDDICTYVCRKIGSKKIKKINQQNSICINF